MASDRVRELADQLVDEFLKTGESHFTERWNITKDDEPTGDEVVVVVYRGKRSRVRSLQESVKSMPVATLPSGTRCPMCGGSGRID